MIKRNSVILNDEKITKGMANEASIDSWLPVAVARLCEHLDPDLILLFGSRARGTETRKSDLDILVVWDTTESPLDRIGHVLRLLPDCPWPLEVVAYTPAELERLRYRSFVKTMLAEGRVLYERRAA